MLASDTIRQKIRVTQLITGKFGLLDGIVCNEEAFNIVCLVSAGHPTKASSIAISNDKPQVRDIAAPTSITVR